MLVFAIPPPLTPCPRRRGEREGGREGERERERESGDGVLLEPGNAA